MSAGTIFWVKKQPDKGFGHIRTLQELKVGRKYEVRDGIDDHLISYVIVRGNPKEEFVGIHQIKVIK